MPNWTGKLSSRTYLASSRRASQQHCTACDMSGLNHLEYDASSLEKGQVRVSSKSDKNADSEASLSCWERHVPGERLSAPPCLEKCCVVRGYHQGRAHECENEHL